jgi:hypothetical protein
VLIVFLLLFAKHSYLPSPPIEEGEEIDRKIAYMQILTCIENIVPGLIQPFLCIYNLNWYLHLTHTVLPGY